MPTITFDRIGRDTGIRPLRTEAVTAAAVAAAVHHHARAILGSRAVGVTLEGDHGQIRLGASLVGEFTVHADDQQPDPPPRRRDPMHGYTLADLQHLTRTVLRFDRWHQAADIHDRYDAVWHALAEHLADATTTPTRSDLLRAGTEASDAYVRDEMRTHGRDTSKPGPMPRFHMYWHAANTPSHEPRIVEREALTQIWPLLRDSEQRALTALAVTGDYEEAARIYGAAPRTFSVVISTARRRFFALWHEGETPSRQWRTDRRVRSRDGRDHLGRQRLTVSQVDAYRQRRHDGELLRVLAAEAGLTAAGLGRLLSGASNAARDAA